MKILLLIAFLIPAASWAQCTQRVDPNNVVIFLDTNTGDDEIVKAQQGACQSGRRLVVIPRNYREHGTILVPWLRAHRATEAACGGDRYNSNACQTASTRENELDERYSRFSATQPDLQTSVRNELAQLQRSGARVSNLILSGHDGGGHFGGKKGSMSRDGLSSLMSEFPGVNKVESVILAGCFTGVNEEAPQWRSAFPDLRSLYGYDGYAPLSDRPAGHDYIRSALVNDRRLRAQPNIAALNRAIPSLIGSVSNLNAGMHIALDCNEEDMLAYTSAGGRRFASVDNVASECRAGAAQLQTIARNLSSYLEGRTEPPSDPSGLRTVYQNARQLQHCISDLDIPLDVNQLFNMRFLQANETNFALFYADDLARAGEILSSMVSAGDLWIPNRQNLEAKNRAAVLANNHSIYSLLGRSNLPPRQRQALTWLKNVSERHLQHLQNPFEWHEVTGPNPAAPAQVERLPN